MSILHQSHAAVMMSEHVRHGTVGDVTQPFRSVLGAHGTILLSFSIFSLSFSHSNLLLLSISTQTMLAHHHLVYMIE